MIVIIDNYDSFVYNLARYVQLIGLPTRVVRNDQITIAEIKSIHPLGIILSPGPCRPEDAGICVPLVQELASQIPILGVCLGHQAIGQAFGAEIVKAAKPMHGMASLIEHNNSRLFSTIPSPLTAARYHSLVIDPRSIPSCLAVTAWSTEQEVMAVEHTSYPTFGVQFHPESILTKPGKVILERWCNVCEEHVIE